MFFLEKNINKVVLGNVQGKYFSFLLFPETHLFAVFGRFLRPAIDQKIPSVDIWVPKMHFPKMYLFGAPIKSTGPGMVSS